MSFADEYERRTNDMLTYLATTERPFVKHYGQCSETDAEAEDYENCIVTPRDSAACELALRGDDPPWLRMFATVAYAFALETAETTIDVDSDDGTVRETRSAQLIMEGICGVLLPSGLIDLMYGGTEDEIIEFLKKNEREHAAKRRYRRLAAKQRRAKLAHELYKPGGIMAKRLQARQAPGAFKTPL